jgi:peptidoglycan/xylan/chitin deacetylase (PgdA/CDA1 family)
MSFRFDRFATLYVFHPLNGIASGNNRAIPILMYHSIADDREAVHPYYRTSTSPAQFAAQMKYLFNHGYRTACLAEAVGQLQSSAAPAERLVVVTFDDGFRDFYAQAFPVLRQYGFHATVFLPTAFIDDTARSFKGKDCLTWSEVRELNQMGTRFGSHTVTHPQLRDLSSVLIDEEIKNSKNTIEDKLGCAIDSFAYPYAFPQSDTDFKKKLQETLRMAGYSSGVCTVVGRANRKSEPLFLERLPVNSCDDQALLQAKLAGSYDWIAKPQYLAKLGKTLARGWFAGAKHLISNGVPSGS